MTSICLKSANFTIAVKVKDNQHYVDKATADLEANLKYQVVIVTPKVRPDEPFMVPFSNVNKMVPEDGKLALPMDSIFTDEDEEVDQDDTLIDVAAPKPAVKPAATAKSAVKKNGANTGTKP